MSGILKRKVTNDGVNFKNVIATGEREIFYNGKPLAEQDLTMEEQNALNKVIDSFEDGGNKLEGEYEVYEYGHFKIRRKVVMFMFD